MLRWYYRLCESRDDFALSHVKCPFMDADVPTEIGGLEEEVLS
jgi:hypothetical protein